MCFLITPLNAIIILQGRTILAAIRLIPAGVVIFVSSFAFAEELRARWDKTGLSSKFMARKRVLWEERGADLDALLDAYACAARAKDGGGAMLFCVVGGKLSEGINFSDDMARAVIMVGLPYAPPGDPVMLAKMARLDEPGSPTTGHEWNVNQCMNKVNQSIGRSIRHIGVRFVDVSSTVCMNLSVSCALNTQMPSLS